MEAESFTRLNASGAEGEPRAGTHLCLLYESEVERREVVSRFVEEGLAAGERVAYFADDEPDLVLAWLRERGVEVSARPQFSVAPARSVYCPEGEFFIEPMFDYWRAFHREAQALGLAGARGTGETNWCLETPGGERIVEYEARLNDLLVELPVTALCQYDVRRFDGAAILDILRVHPLMLIAGQVVANPYYIRPQEFLELRRDTVE